MSNTFFQGERKFFGEGFAPLLPSSYRPRWASSTDACIVFYLLMLILTTNRYL